jgi:hypothetical protein
MKDLKYIKKFNEASENLNISDVSKRFQLDMSRLEDDLLLTINGSVLGSYTKEEIERRLSNTLKQIKKLKDFNVC